MSLKTCLLTVALLFSLSCFAQDKIYTKKGDVIEGKVVAVSDKTVSYKRADNINGPDYTINKKEVTKILYQNGSTDTFDGNAGGERTSGRAKHSSGKGNKNYGNNILSIIPGAYTSQVNFNDLKMNDPGIGISYERLLDQNGHIGFTLPVMINFISANDFSSVNVGYPGSLNPSGYTSVTFMPGIKFYPARKGSMFRYSMGASFFTIFGKEPFFVYDGNSGSTDDYHYTIYGLMFSNSLNISPTQHLYLSLDMNTGMPVSDNRQANTSFDFVFSPLFQFILSVGYRF